MHPIVKCLALCGLSAVAACGTSSLTAAPPVVQSVVAEPEPAPVRTPRARRAAAGRESESLSSASPQDAKPLDYNSAEWKEREKRRDEELNRKIKGICSGC